jgi:Cu(I)/Ag(I) efflux system membrane fusion protein
MTTPNATTGSSPFDTTVATPFRRLLRVAVPVLIVAGSLVAAFVLTLDVPDEATAAAHTHGAAPGTIAAPVTLDTAEMRRIGVTFAVVESGPITAKIRSLGQVTYDETRTTAISPKVDGWVEKLHINFTGQEVRQGDALLDIYSPMLVTAQEELLLAVRLVGDVENGTAEARRAADEMLTSARRRLQYWDISASDVERIERTGQTSRTITLRAGSRGVVVEKSVLSGQRIMAGETLYRLADLRSVWVDGQLFEHDLALVRTGQRVSVEIQAYPGEQWAGSVTYVYPLVDAATRTARVRIELANPRLRLKPGMFATVHLTGAIRERVLTVPRSAVLATGQRSIVFLKAADGTLQPRAVVAGVANDDRVEIRSGLQAGDTVVASATFLVDAESNLKGALGGMAGMPGMDTPDARPVRPIGAPVPRKDSVKGVPPDDDHSKHGMADTIASRTGADRRKE